MSVAAIAAVTALVAGGISVTLILILHFVEPEYDPSWRMISEYSLGRHGWRRLRPSTPTLRVPHRFAGRGRGPHSRTSPQGEPGEQECRSDRGEHGRRAAGHRQGRRAGSCGPGSGRARGGAARVG